jgi:hypothetical protein
MGCCQFWLLQQVMLLLLQLLPSRLLSARRGFSI